MSRTATRRSGRRGAGAATAAAAVLAAAVRTADAQGFGMPAAGRLTDWADAAVGSEEENYLRLLQVAGVARFTPWTLRPLGPRTLAGLLPDSAAHPWAARTRLAGRRGVRVLPLGAQAVYNSSAPFSMNDGFLWTGRGATLALRGGVSARWGALSVRLEPQLGLVQNQTTRIAPNGLTGAARFGDALEPAQIDAPQRFGDRAFAQLSPGQSTVRLDAFGIAAGVSTANQWLGPSGVDPLVLGTNASGFLHAFVGTGRPIPVGVGTVRLNAQAGRLGQSAYTNIPRDSARRLLTALSAAITVRGLPGLELGGTRLFHSHYPADGNVWPQVRRVGQGFFYNGGDPAGGLQQNQLASLWGRWAFAGAEVWGEFMRNDASVDVRDFWQEPDQNSGYAAGARRVWGGGAGRLQALRFETLNTRITHLQRVRGQTRPYQHTPLRQGHTVLGQLLGSAAAQGGLATTLGWDRYQADGRWTVEAARRVVQSALGEGAPADAWDVLTYVRAERLRFGREGDLVLGAAAVAELNRGFGRDTYGVRLDLGWRFGRVPARQTPNRAPAGPAAR